MDGLSVEEFVAKTIIEVCKGIMQSQKEIIKMTNNCPIAPSDVKGKDVVNEKAISFDLAVTTSSSKSTKGNVGMDIKVIGADMGQECKLQKESVSRVKFEVPFYPQGLTRFKKE